MTKVEQRYKVKKLGNAGTVNRWFVYDTLNKFGPTQRQSYEWVGHKLFEDRAEARAYAKELNSR